MIQLRNSIRILVFTFDVVGMVIMNQMVLNLQNFCTHKRIYVLNYRFWNLPLYIFATSFIGFSWCVDLSWLDRLATLQIAILIFLDMRFASGLKTIEL